MKLTEYLHHWENIVFLGFCLITFIQVFYYLFFFARLAFYKSKSKLISQTHPVSVIICSRDEAANLVKNLPGALIQQYRTTHEARFIPGKKFPLSIGIKTAKHEIVLLTDADCVPATEFWIEKMQEGFNDGIEIVLGYGALHKKKGFFNKLVRWE